MTTPTYLLTLAILIALLCAVPLLGYSAWVVCLGLLGAAFAVVARMTI